jgi:hypothetical protein
MQQNTSVHKTLLLMRSSALRHCTRMLAVQQYLKLSYYSVCMLLCECYIHVILVPAAATAAVFRVNTMIQNYLWSCAYAASCAA